MKNKDSKEAHWIDEIRVRRQSLYSNVILIETDDQGRIIELLEGFQKRAPFAKYDENEQENWFILDGWKGVMGVTPDPNNVFALNPLPDLQGGPYGIDPLLENIEEMLLEENTVLVIQNIYESSRAFNAALLSWASNDGIRAADSTIILFTPSRDIFPERVWGRMSIIRPPRSTADERHELLREAQFSMPVDNLKVDEETDGELAALTALTAGMTKDQLEAAAVESIIRYQELNMDSIAKAKERILADNPILEVNERPKFGFDGVGGYDRVKEVIRNYIVLPQEQPEYAKRFDVSKPRGIIFFGPPGCFVEGTMVPLADGTLKTIETFGTKHLQDIKSKILTTKENPKDEAVQFHIYKNCPCYEVITETGRRVECSYNQPFWTKDNEWKQADELKGNEHIEVATRYENTKKENVIIKPKNLYSKKNVRKGKNNAYALDEELASLFGYAFGDGNAHFRCKPKKPYGISMVVNEEEKDIIPQLIKKSVDTLGKEPKIRIKKPKDGTYDGRIIKRKQEMTYLEIDNLEIGSLFYFLHQKKRKRTPPKEILQSPKKVVASFLRWYYEADGSCRGGGRGQGKHNNVDLKSSNPKTLEIIQQLLLQFNIKARIYDKNLSIFRAEDIRKFYREIGFASKKKKTKLDNLIKKLPIERTNKCERFEKVRSVREIGERTVYDLTTESQEFIANGIKVHNTGKTLFVNSMAKELNMSVLKLQMEHILGKYVGESEKSMRLVFDVADAMSPCILFIDEIDKFSKRDMGAGTNQGSHVERELFSMLLEKLGDEKRKWLFVGATNIVEALDPALIRTGRVDSVIPIPFPDKEARKEIFNIHANKKRNPPLAGDIDLDEIAEKTHLWSGSDIEQLVVRTTNYVMKEAILEENIERKIQMDDVRTIIDSFNIDTKKNGQLQEKIKKQALEYTNDKRLINIFESAPKIRPKSRVRKGAEVMKKKRLDEKSRKDSKN